MVLMTPRFVLNIEKIFRLVEDRHLDFSFLIHYGVNALSPQTWEANTVGSLF